MQLLLARPRGFCAGVERAVQTVQAALARFGAPVHVFHQIVHNHRVVHDLAVQGAVFVEHLDAVPRHAVLVFSAHGVSDEVRAEAHRRQLTVIDATCPLVSKVHQQARQYAAQRRAVVLIGHAGHDEVVGTLGSVGAPAHLVATAEDVRALPLPDDAPVAYVTQTTLSIDDTRQVIAALEQRFADLRGPQLTDICYATQNRQLAVRTLASRVDLLLVVGARHSSNACRLHEVALQCGVAAHLVEDAGEIEPAWLHAAPRAVGVTAGASTPETLVQGVCERLMSLGADAPAELPGDAERVIFRLPDGVAPAPASWPYQVISNTHAGAPIAMQAVSTTRARGETSAWNRRSNVAAK